MNIRSKAVGIAIAASLMLIIGCNPVTKLYKEQDYDKMYKAAMDFYEKGHSTKKKIHFNRAIQLFENIAPAYTGTMREDSIAFHTASAYYRTGEYFDSNMLFDNFRRAYPKSVFIERAEYLYVMGHYNSSAPATRDQTTTKRSIMIIDEFLQRYPYSTYREYCIECRTELINQLYEHTYLSAKTYYKIRKYKSAITAARNAAAKYPDSPYREELLFITLDSSYEYARNSVPGKQRDRFLNMMDYYYTFVAEFPESKHRASADKMVQAARDFFDSQDRIENIAAETETSAQNK